MRGKRGYYASLIADHRHGSRTAPFHLVRNDVSDDIPDWSMGLLLIHTETTLPRRKEALLPCKSCASMSPTDEKWDQVLDDLADVDTPEALEQSVAVLCCRVRGDANVREQFENAVQERLEMRTASSDEDRTGRNAGSSCRSANPGRRFVSGMRSLRTSLAGVGIDYDQPPVPRRRDPTRNSWPDLSLGGVCSHWLTNPIVHGFWWVLPEKVSPDDEDYLLGQLSTGDPHQMILAFRGLEDNWVLQEHLKR